MVIYLLEGVVQLLRRWLHLPRLLASVLVFILFVAFVLFLLLGLLPMVSRQLSQLIQQLPNMIVEGQNLLLSLPTMYPEFITEVQSAGRHQRHKGRDRHLGSEVLSWSLAAGMGIITITIYVVLVPLLVFFFLKDKDLILKWLHGFLPHDHTLAQQCGARWTGRWAIMCAVSFWKCWWSGPRPS